MINYRRTKKINPWLKLCYITMCVCLGWGRGTWKWNLREKNSILWNEFQFYALIVLCNMIMLLVAPSSQLIMIIIMKKNKIKKNWNNYCKSCIPATWLFSFLQVPHSQRTSLSRLSRLNLSIYCGHHQAFTVVPRPTSLPIIQLYGVLEIRLVVR